MSTANIERELKKLERKEKLLAKKREALLDQQRLLQNNTDQVKKIFESSGYSSPAELVQALSSVYGLRGAGKIAKVGGKRQHTRVTVQLRDQVKQALAAKQSKTQIIRDFGISFPVVAKIEKGGYDKL